MKYKTIKINNTPVSKREFAIHCLKNNLGFGHFQSQYTLSTLDSCRVIWCRARKELNLAPRPRGPLAGIDRLLGDFEINYYTEIAKSRNVSRTEVIAIILSAIARDDLVRAILEDDTI